MKKIFKLIFTLFISLGISLRISESKNLDSGVPAAETRVIAVSHVSDIPASELQNLASFFGFEEQKHTLIYDVRVDKIVYTTLYKGKSISASGLMYTPREINKAFPIISVQHATLFQKSEAPSVSLKLSGGEFIASSGFITVAPDYIGYGASSEIFHPYYDQLYSAGTVVDMIQAAKNVLDIKGIPYEPELFLFGYSEGGYVTLAAQKAIEADPIEGLNLTAVSAGAGGYDLIKMLNSVISSGYYPYPSYLAFIVQSYNITYDWNKSLNYFFRDKYAQKLYSILGGSEKYNDSPLTARIDSLFNPDFYKNLKRQKETALEEALERNSLVNWIPKTPLRMYHGTADEVVPYENSKSTYIKFKEAGATVELIPIESGTHFSSFAPMVKSTFLWFESLKEQVQ